MGFSFPSLLPSPAGGGVLSPRQHLLGGGGFPCTEYGVGGPPCRWGLSETLLLHSLETEGEGQGGKGRGENGERSTRTVPGTPWAGPVLGQRPGSWRADLLVSSVQTYCVPLGLGQVLPFSKLRVPHLFTNGRIWGPSHGVMAGVRQDYPKNPVAGGRGSVRPSLLSVVTWAHSLCWQARLTMCGTGEGCSWKGHPGSVTVC